MILKHIFDKHNNHSPIIYRAHKTNAAVDSQDLRYVRMRKLTKLAIVLLLSLYYTASAHAVIVKHSSLQFTPDSSFNGKTNSAISKSAAPAGRPAADTAWKPVRKFWGLAFGDFYYDAKSDAANRGAETNYYGVPTYRNAFQFRRLLLGYNYDIDRKFTAEILLASEPNANTPVSGTTSISNGDNLADNKMSFYVKVFDLRWKNIWKGSDFLIGESLTPVTVLLTEKVWGYRSVEKTIADFHREPLFDVGASLQGNFDPQTKNFGYDFMIGNNSLAGLLPAANPNTGFFKAFYGDVYAWLFNRRLVLDLFADYMQTASSTVAVGAQSRNMIKGLAAWTTPKITFGVEAYSQKLVNGIMANNGSTKTAENATVGAISIYSHGSIYKNKLGFFARYDSYNPDNDFNNADIYTVNTNLSAYNPYYKEHFVTAGLDYSPSKNVHFMPNLWFIQYADQRAPGATGYVPDGHTLVYRLTFFFTFGN